MVIIGHSWPLSGESDVPRLAGISVHHLGVYIFFSISGFLLAASWRRDPRPIAFLLRRSMRIFPALIVVVAVTVAVIGPLVSDASAGEYWGAAETWGYFANIALIAQYELPGVFTDNPTTAVNGSLWSLGPEFCSYVMLVLAGLLGATASRIVRTVLGLAIIGLTLFLPLQGPLRTTAAAVVFFIVGSLIAEASRAWKLPLWPALVLVPALIFTSSGVGLAVAWIAVPYLVIALGARTSGAARLVQRIGDPSYGMYLWAFPAQQVLIQLCGSPPPLWVSMVIVLLVSLAFGFASWHGVERRAISWGGRMSRALGRSRMRV